VIAIILIAHAKIASETKVAVEHILGEQDLLEAVNVMTSDAANNEKEHFFHCYAAQTKGKVYW
jgi:mannose/fructose-specific phosphotransferase system component IIA